MADKQTLDFYRANATTYAETTGGRRSPRLAAFIAALPAGARVLELGAGSGYHAAEMARCGIDIDATDASAELAAEAQRRIGRPVRLLRFADLAADREYDGVWASASLLHAPVEELTEDLGRIHRALKPGGLFVASFKAGQGEGRDGLGRYYNYPDRAGLLAHYKAAAPWGDLRLETAMGSGYDKLPTEWLWVTARR